MGDSNCNSSWNLPLLIPSKFKVGDSVYHKTMKENGFIKRSYFDETLSIWCYEFSKGTYNFFLGDSCYAELAFVLSRNIIVEKTIFK